MIRTVGLRKSYHSNEVLKGIDLTIPAGQVVSLIGPSGSGKSTLLRTMNGLEVIQEGFIEFDGNLLGKTIKKDRFHEMSRKQARLQRADIGMVFQNFNLFPHLTVMENITQAPRAVRGLNKADADKRAKVLLDRVGLADKANGFPRQLSGGQQQRVAIARALALEPKLMLFDEPTSALDPELVGEVLSVIRDIANDGTTMLIVTHEMSFARDISHRVLFLDGGVIESDGTPDYIFGACDNIRTRSFVQATANRGESSTSLAS